MLPGTVAFFLSTRLFFFVWIFCVQSRTNAKLLKSCNRVCIRNDFYFLSTSFSRSIWCKCGDSFIHVSVIVVRYILVFMFPNTCIWVVFFFAFKCKPLLSYYIYIDWIAKEGICVWMAERFEIEFPLLFSRLVEKRMRHIQRQTHRSLSTNNNQLDTKYMK